MADKIVIIGAGIAGLSAGCYARMNGYDTEIFEANNAPGGLCTSWKRGGYTFDGCIHWLTGSGPADSFYQLWEELGAVQGREMADHEIFQRYRDADGREFILYTDIDRLEKHLLELSPEDAGNIHLLCRLARRFTRFNFPMTKANELNHLFDTIKMIMKFLPFMKDFNYCNNLTMGEFARSFRDPLIREAIPMVFGGPENSLVALVVTLALMHKKAGGFPLGGSLEFSRSIEKRYLDLGGVVHYGAKVEKIITNGAKVKGIRLTDGREILAHQVISASDLRNTLFGLLDGAYLDPVHRELLDHIPTYPTSVQVSFGIRNVFHASADAVTTSYRMPKPFRIGNEEHQWLAEHNYSFDPGMAPEGCSVITSMFRVDDFRFWERLYSDRQAYKEEKRRIVETVAAQFAMIYPGFTSFIEESDVVTPMTYVRYTGNWKGTYMTWNLVGKNSRKFQVIPKQVPGLDNFWLAGMWLMAPGGVPSGAKTGRDVIQLICRKDKKRFIALKPL